MNLPDKKSILVFDIETSAMFPDGTPIDIRTSFKDYVLRAKCKWFGAYSYKYDCYVTDVVKGNEENIIKLLEEHDILVGFNNTEFDTPILFNNGLMLEDKRHLQVDCLQILGSNTYYGHDGMKYKNRGALMGFKFRRNNLRAIAEAMKLETKKGDIDYKIFQKDEWSPEEIIQIKEYLESDVKATKQMFDKLWEYWMPFTEWLSEKNVMNLSWIRSSIASLTYKCACNKLGKDDTYADDDPEDDDETEEMGGRVIEPRREESWGVWKVDARSLYPHMYAMFNLFAECQPLAPNAVLWHGNEMFKVRGYYDISNHHVLSMDIMEKLQERLRLKELDPKNPKQYAIKILLNSLYGAQRSKKFELIYTQNGGWDCCWLGQQVHEFAEKAFESYGYEVIAGDTDSWFLLPRSKELDDAKNVQLCIDKIIADINAHVPFPQPTFTLAIEGRLDYVMWAFEDVRERGADGKMVTIRKGKKKNYVYLEYNEVTAVGLPVIKDNATKIGVMIWNEVLKSKIVAANRAKFTFEDIMSIANSYLERPNATELLAVEYKVKKADSYKKESQIQAQISVGYFGGQDGVISLIKNNRVGKAGKGSKYCTVEEAREQGLMVAELDLEKLWNEMQPFCMENIEKRMKPKKVKE